MMPKRIKLDEKKLLDKRSLLLVGLTISIAVLFFLQVILSASAAVTGERIYGLELKKKKLQLSNNQLRSEIQQVSSLGYVEKIAREKLSMVDSTKHTQFITPDFLAQIGEVKVLN